MSSRLSLTAGALVVALVVLVCGGVFAAARAPAVLHAAVPSSYDFYAAHAECVGVAKLPRMGNCSGAHAFAVAESFGARLCVSGAVALRTPLSVQHLISCNPMSMGCFGGSANDTYHAVGAVGAVDDACWTYENADAQPRACSAFLHGRCASSAATPRVYHASKVRQVHSLLNIDNAPRIQAEIAAGGPVAADMDVYDDLPRFTNASNDGVYVHGKDAALLGRMTVTLLGWGESPSSKTPYWIARAYAFGDNPRFGNGNGGLFWIARGKEECQIEKDVWAGDAGSSSDASAASAAEAMERAAAARLESLVRAADAAQRDDGDAPAIDAERVARINAMQTSWVAHESPVFRGKTKAEARRLLGVPMPAGARPPTREQVSKKKYVPSYPVVALPESFDARTRWPSCVHPILNQGNCGSCWAFSVAESMSDRACIASAGAVNVQLSPQALLQCDKADLGCGGGYPNVALEYVTQSGLPTLDCLPYTADASEPCPGTQCANDTNAPSNARVFAWPGSIWTVLGEEAIQAMLINNGPVTAVFYVFDDFFAYKSGVYVPAPPYAMEGEHAVKIVGWGVDAASGLKYWNVANSWGSTWGMDGFFWIVRGTDACTFEDDVCAAFPDLTRS